VSHNRKYNKIRLPYTGEVVYGGEGMSEKEKLGLPWEPLDDDKHQQGAIINKEGLWVCIELEEPLERDFILKAVNNHHALVEALEGLVKCIDNTRGVDAHNALNKSIEALQAVKDD
jgi:hypothetical protein